MIVPSPFAHFSFLFYASLSDVQPLGVVNGSVGLNLNSNIGQFEEKRNLIHFVKKSIYTSSRVKMITSLKWIQHFLFHLNQSLPINSNTLHRIKKMKFSTIFSTLVIASFAAANPIVTEVVVNTIEVVHTATTTVTYIAQETAVTSQKFR